MKKIVLILLPAVLLLSFKPRISSFKKLVKWVKAHPGEVPDMDDATLNQLTGLQPQFYTPAYEVPGLPTQIQANHIMQLHYLHDDLLLVMSDGWDWENEDKNTGLPIWTISASDKQIDRLMRSGNIKDEQTGIQTQWRSNYYPVVPDPVVKIHREVWKLDPNPIPERIINHTVLEDTVLYYQVNSQGKFVPLQTNEDEMKRRMAWAKKPEPRERNSAAIRRMLKKAQKPKRLAATLLRGKSLFASKCSSCHAHDERRVAPPLRGILKKYEGEEAWLYDWISNSPGMVAKGDTRAVALWEANYKQAMTAFPYLGDHYITDILIYLDQD